MRKTPIGLAAHALMCRPPPMCGTVMHLVPCKQNARVFACSAHMHSVHTHSYCDRRSHHFWLRVCCCVYPNHGLRQRFVYRLLSVESFTLAASEHTSFAFAFDFFRENGRFSSEIVKNIHFPHRKIGNLCFSIEYFSKGRPCGENRAFSVEKIEKVRRKKRVPSRQTELLFN